MMSLVDSLKTKLKPRPYQIAGIEAILKHRGFMLGFDMGTGKTKTALDALVLLAASSLAPCLVVCPKPVIGVWPPEFEKHVANPGAFSILALDNKWPVKRKTETSAEHLAHAEALGKTAVIIINYESACREPFASWSKNQIWGLVVADESQWIKSASGKMSRYMSQLGDRAFKRVALTGTPMPHSPLDIYAQFRFFDKTIFGTSFAAFKAEFAICHALYKSKVLRFINQDVLQKKFLSRAIVVKKRDVLDLPPVTEIEHIVEMGPKAKRVYNEMEKTFVAEVDGGTLEASNALTRLLRLQQATSGFAKLSENHQPVLDTAKADALTYLLEGIPLGEPVVVFAQFHNDLSSIAKCAEALGRKTFQMWDGVNELAGWQSDTGGSVLVAQIRAGGVGNNMTRACYSVYFSVGFNRGAYEQSLARIDRGGQTRASIVYHLIAEGTVDRKIYNAIKTGRKLVSEVLSSYSAPASLIESSECLGDAEGPSDEMIF